MDSTMKPEVLYKAEIANAQGKFIMKTWSRKCVHADAKYHWCYRQTLKHSIRNHHEKIPQSQLTDSFISSSLYKGTCKFYLCASLERDKEHECLRGQ